MDATMNFYTQDIWTWWIAIYLYFGGLGAATLAVTFLTDMYLKAHRDLVLWGAFSGIVLLSLGSLMLFIHLLDYRAVIYVLNPMILFTKPDAWIAWGTQFIVWMMFWGVIYALPYMYLTPLFDKMPVVGKLLDLALVKKIAELSSRFRKVVGWMATINGVGVAVYTGLLLQSFPAVALWHNPGVPLLFTVSAFSTAMAFLLLIMYTIIKREEDEHIRHFYERVDLILISAELVILFSFYHYMSSGNESAMHSARLLWNDLGWLIGFIGFGLIVPFFLELRGVLKGWASHLPIITASVLVLIGGYLLRHYFMYAGVYAYPW
ncbi:NrfD/PsrC family molybdoenzyme membrane anchor subunit [Candidatus Endoriftia persephone]|jgi:formate-dependent nitrite reductase membrane component NrfD|uniref:Cytochrome c nitrite/polysulfide reductase, NrfD subunit n=3 Tax=Gammaproteobacteria TaxID=1236 RepID=G2DDZ6_9GAMM|nr:NrfD/PsrC family molybdoenzyme membrane anchor subunit [Candidatus Endoriftia persephone]EGV51160.1 cytochrome c nitrite/polysulfide reductase, NrfD subunit [endosymbiont of Riftia pachyptila (vent Ph05)]EGW53528.1 putative cytochrome c nitrite reductase NrfD subunit [endosymbiont of Tevnia jerichonana (vent Tica)]USF86861.1 polysulfide reductase NrfD [Candidatus Endoriftia persephone]